MLVHGLTDHRDGFVLPQLASALADAGVCSLRLDMRGNGESEGDFEFANMRDEARSRNTAPRSDGNIRSVTRAGRALAGAGVCSLSLDMRGKGES